MYLQILKKNIGNLFLINYLLFGKYISILKIQSYLVDKIYSTFNTHSSHAITQDVNLIETAKAATFFMSDAVIITGTATGQPAEPNDVNGNFKLKT